MKLKFFCRILVAVTSLTMLSCSNTDDIISGNDTPPAGALPSVEFTLNNLPDEPYAEDAIRIEAQDEQAPFYAIELMPDGHYLLSTYRPYYTAPACVAMKAGGCFSVGKKRNRETVWARSTRADDGTITLPTGESYGEFTKLGNGKYRLGNGDEIDLMDVTGSGKKVTYRGLDGRVSNVYVNVSAPISGNATRSLCRTWNYNSFELWAYRNGNYVFHGKQTLDNGVVSSSFKSIGGNMFEKEDFLYDDDDFCHKVIFTSVGTYLCFYLNGDMEVSRWKWMEKDYGTLYYNHSETGDYYEGDGYVTVRFAGKQMRIYEDYTDSEDNENMRIVIVNTLTAAN